MTLPKQKLRKGQIVYGFQTPDGKQFYVPAGIKVLSIGDESVKLQYRFGDIETVSADCMFRGRR